jgi:hypothetical protein
MLRNITHSLGPGRVLWQDLRTEKCRFGRQIKSRRMGWAENVTRMGEERNLNKVLVGKPEGKKPFGRPRRRWDQNGS